MDKFRVNKRQVNRTRDCPDSGYQQNTAVAIWEYSTSQSSPSLVHVIARIFSYDCLGACQRVPSRLYSGGKTLSACLGSGPARKFSLNFTRNAGPTVDASTLLYRSSQPMIYGDYTAIPVSVLVEIALRFADYILPNSLIEICSPQRLASWYRPVPHLPSHT